MTPAVVAAGCRTRSARLSAPSPRKRMRWVMRLVLVTLVLALGASVPAEARNQTIAPPGNSGVSQYLESVPTASGSRPTNTIQPGGGGSHRSGGSAHRAARRLGRLRRHRRIGSLRRSKHVGWLGRLGRPRHIRWLRRLKLGQQRCEWAVGHRTVGQACARRAGPRRAGGRSARASDCRRRTDGRGWARRKPTRLRRLGGLDQSRILPDHRTRQGDDRFEQQRRAWTAASGDPDHQPARRRHARAGASATDQLTPGRSCASLGWPSSPRCCSPAQAHQRLTRCHPSRPVSAPTRS